MEEEHREKEKALKETRLQSKQLEKLAHLLVIERKKNQSRVLNDMDELRLKYIAREEKYVLDGDRDELKTIRRELEELRCGIQLSNTGGNSIGRDMKKKTSRVSSTFNYQKENQRGVEETPEMETQIKPTTASSNQNELISNNTAQARASSELKRLQTEKQDLLKSGVYDQDSFMVKELDKLIHIEIETKGRLGYSF